MTRIKRGVWNFSAGLVGSTVALLAGLAGTPLILYFLGAERFGAFRVLLDWLGNLSLLDFGVSGSMAARLAPHIASGRRSETVDILAAGLRTQMKVTAAMLTAGAALVWAAPYLLSSTALTAAEVRLSTTLLLIPALWTPLTVFRALLEVRQQSYLINLLLALQTLLSAALFVAAAWAGWGLTGQAGASALASVPLMLFLLLRGAGEFPDTFTATPTLTALAQVRSLSRPTFLFNLTSRAALYTDNILIAWMLGAPAVAPFFLTQRLAQIVQLQLQGIGNATWAGLVELHAQGNSARFCSRLMDLTSLVSGLGLALLIPVAAFNREFVSLWVGNRQYAGDWVSILACGNAWIWSITSLWGWPISGAGYIAAWTPYAIRFAVINIAVSIVATRLAGFAGPLVGTLAGFLLVHAWVLPRLLGRTFGPSLRHVWKPALMHFLWAVPFAVVTWLLAGRSATRGGIALGVEAGLAVLIGFALCWFALETDLRTELRGHLKQVFRP